MVVAKNDWGVHGMHSVHNGSGMDGLVDWSVHSVDDGGGVNGLVDWGVHSVNNGSGVHSMNDGSGVVGLNDWSSVVDDTGEENLQLVTGYPAGRRFLNLR
jgi:hypothetical protein